MLLSKSCIYGLRASVLLASKNQDNYVNIRELSDELNISFHFLTKILQQLTQSQILESYKGPNGGIKLAKTADSITFMNIVSAIDTDHTIHECLFGLPGCGELKPCPVHDKWSALKEELLEMMNHTTLQDLADRGSYVDLREALRDGNDFFNQK